MVQINLLPWREQARQLSKIHFIATAGMVVVCSFVAIVFIHIYLNRQLDYQGRRITYLQSELGKEQGQLNVLVKRKKDQIIVDGELDFILALREKSYRAVQLLDALVRIVPADVSFNKVIRKGDGVTLVGKAKSNLQVTLLMKNIIHSKLFKQPDLNQIVSKDGAQGEERLFTLNVEQLK
ncbi:MAG: PilN domain-containing protein [Gammaproteobacteria bacterium]